MRKQGKQTGISIENQVLIFSITSGITLHF
ncbi:MAG: hypothetical protein ACI9LN_001286 [Saprospiraceae bacterium]|jgi:hypothetical protein